MSTTPRTDAECIQIYSDDVTGCSDARDYVDASFARTLETELAEAKAECERLKFATEGHLLKTIQQQAELAHLRAELAVAENWVEHHSKHAYDLIAENVKLRADLERFTGHGLLDCHAICDQRDAAVAERDRLLAELKELSQAYELNRVSIDELDADRARAEKAEAEVERLKRDYEYEHKCLHEVRERCESWKQRAERAEAELAEWSVLNLWGGTPEIIHEFIKGQQNRIHHCQDLEAEFLEQARLLGMSGEREADLLGKLERLARDKARMDWLEEKMWFVRANVMLHDEVPPYTVKTCDGIVHGATVRAAIDAAMSP